MSRFVYNTATSLNGFIADDRHRLDWLFAVPDDGTEADQAAFMAGVGTQVMGSSTYEWVVREEDLLVPGRWVEVMGPQPAFVFSSRELELPPGAPVTLLRGDVAGQLDRIRDAAEGLDVWVVGGGALAAQFIVAGALDRVVLSIAPAVLASGAPLLPLTVGAERLRLTEARPLGAFARLVFEVLPA